MLAVEVGVFVVAALSHAGLLVLLLVSGRSVKQGRWLLLATAATILWAVGCSLLLWSGRRDPLLLLDACRSAIWIAFLVRFPLMASSASSRPWPLPLLMLCGAFLLVAYVALGVFGYAPGGVFVALIGLSLFGLMALEQLYRSARQASRWTLTPFCLAIGALFAYDLFVFSHATLFQAVDPQLWMIRGVLCAVIVPGMLMTAKRHPDWEKELFVSRQVVFYSAALAGVGLYCIAMGLGGYVIRSQGGQWSGALQALFFVAAIAVLLWVMFSTQLRARAKVFLAKHFYRNRYDYREEWLRLTDTLSHSEEGTSIAEQSIQALAQIVGSSGGQLWIARTESDDYDPVASWGMEMPDDVLLRQDPVVAFLAETNWVVDRASQGEVPAQYRKAYGSMQLPEDFIYVPLRHARQLLGIVRLKRPRSLGRFNFEDHDLLKTAGRQVAAFVAQEVANELLAETRQFEAFNKLTAFVMHDLKNLVAQQALLVKNAERHKHRPEFVEDVIRTVDNSVERMRRLLAQLEGRVEASPASRVELRRLVDEVVARCSDREPQPTFTGSRPAWIAADKERLISVITNAVRNAQDATPRTGTVELFLECHGDQAVLRIKDSGIGMDARFLRTRLFRPFDSTKGTQGMGIGAYQAREFVRQAGGDISVTSTPGEGTEFCIRLPMESAAMSAAM